jgi:hypothetical protein
MNTKIYIISNSTDDLVCVGSTAKRILTDRLYRHCSDACNGKNSGLYKHIRHIGQFEFKINLLEEFSCSTEFEMRCREQFWMDKTDSSILLNNRRAISLKKYKEYTAQQPSRSKFEEI